jgi:hypothetical protein
MKNIKTFSIALSIYGLFFLFNHLKNKNRKEDKNKYKNKICKKSISNDNPSSENIDESTLFNERGFLKSSFDSLDENGKLNYSLIHGYI